MHYGKAVASTIYVSHTRWLRLLSVLSDNSIVVGSLFAAASIICGYFVFDPGTVINMYVLPSFTTTSLIERERERERTGCFNCIHAFRHVILFVCVHY